MILIYELCDTFTNEFDFFSLSLHALVTGEGEQKEQIQDVEDQDVS